MRDIAFLDARRELRLACDPPEEVRQLTQWFGTGQDQYAAAGRLAHPLIPFPLLLNANWKIIDDPLQWILQRRKGSIRGKNSGWECRSFCRTRTALLRCVRECCGEVDPIAIEALSVLPEWHP